MEQVFEVTDIFEITNKGCFAVGIVAKGTFCIGDAVKIIRDDKIVKLTSILNIELVNWGSCNTYREDITAFRLSDVWKEDIFVGDIIVNDQ